MKAFLRPRWATLALFLLAPLTSRAIFGVGDIVFDPTSLAETVKIVAQAEQQLSRLSSLLGVSTQQLDQLVQLGVAVGKVSNVANQAASLSRGELEDLLHGLPGLANADLRSLLTPQGDLDVFMGMPLDTWRSAVERPNEFREVLINPALTRIGAAAGLSQPEIAYAQWYAARSPADRANNAARSAVDFSNLMTGAWLENARTRRVNLQALATAQRESAQVAAKASTLIDQQRAQSRVTANTSAILLQTAAQQADASDATLRAIHAQIELLAAQNAAQRNSAAMRVNGSP